MTDLTHVPWDQFPIDAKPEDKVSPNFRVWELTKSETADRLAIDNRFPTPEEAHAAVYLCRNVMQAVRDELGAFSPNSVYRSQALDRALKKKRSNWISKSQHTKGQACDVEVPGVSNWRLAEWIIANLEYDQIILECFNAAKGPYSGWVHVSLKPPEAGANRQEILSYVFDSSQGKYIYVKGLKESP